MSIYAENVLKVALFLFDVIDFWRWSYLHWVEIVWLAATDEYNFYQTSFRAKAKYERHHLVHKQINFEIAVPRGWVFTQEFVLIFNVGIFEQIGAIFREIYRLYVNNFSKKIVVNYPAPKFVHFEFWGYHLKSSVLQVNHRRSFHCKSKQT